MSSPSTPRPDGASQPPKQMSSRLMTMKFMQRSTPANRTPSQSGTPNSEPPSKRRRTEPSSAASTPNASTPKAESYISRFGVGAAFRMRPALEEIASGRVTANNASETQWVLDIPLPTPETISEDEGEATDEDGDVDWNDTNGRQTYGSFKKKKSTAERNLNPGTSSYRRQDDEEDLSELDDEDGEVNSSDGASLDEEEDAHATARAQQAKQKAAAMDYTSEYALAALDKVDVSKSSYARSKGAYVPNGRVGSGARFGKQGSAPNGKFRNKDKVDKKTRYKKR